MTDESAKICALCGTPCDDAPRIRDSHGRYYHDRCYGVAQRAQWRREQALSNAPSVANVDQSDEFASATDGNDTMMAHVIAESHRRAELPVNPETAAAREHGCPVCGAYAHPDARYCTSCGADLKTGEQIRTEVVNARRKRRLLRRFDPMWRLFDLVARRMAPGLAVVCGLLFASTLFAPDPMLKVFTAYVIAMFVLLHLCLTGLALRENLETGLIVLLLPFYSVVYFFESASRSRRTIIWTAVIGLALLAAAYGFDYQGRQYVDQLRAKISSWFGHEKTTQVDDAQP